MYICYLVEVHFSLLLLASQSTLHIIVGLDASLFCWFVVVLMCQQNLFDGVITIGCLVSTAVVYGYSTQQFSETDEAYSLVLR